MGAAAITFGFSIAPKAGGNALKRWLMPLSDTDHYTFTQFDTDKMPDPLVVPLGEAFSFSAPLKKDSDNRPANARARYGNKSGSKRTLAKMAPTNLSSPAKKPKIALPSKLVTPTTAFGWNQKSALRFLALKL